MCGGRRMRQLLVLIWTGFLQTILKWQAARAAESMAVIAAQREEHLGTALQRRTAEHEQVCIEPIHVKKMTRLSMEYSSSMYSSILLPGLRYIILCIRLHYITSYNRAWYYITFVMMLCFFGKLGFQNENSGASLLNTASLTGCTYWRLKALKRAAL